MSLIDDIARRAREAQEERAERRWMTGISEALDLISRQADEAGTMFSILHRALNQLENTQVEAEDEEVMAFVRNTKRLLEKYDEFGRFGRMMEHLSEQANRLSDTFKA